MQKDIDEVVKVVEDTITETSKKVTESTFLKLFPITIVLAVVYGITAVTHGAERIFAQVPLFVDHPLVLLVSGLVVLLITGKLYQKFG